MKLDFYLSDMSVSEGHGGGLTLQRVLGEVLNEISLFVHVSRFALDFPAVDHLKSRCLDLVSPLELDFVRRAIGCRPANWLCERQISQTWQGRRVARQVAARFAGEKRPLRALVCPQGVSSLNAMEALVRLCPVDYISWVMDDHLVRWCDGTWRYPHGIEALFARHLQGAKRVLVISPPLADFYRQRFGVDAQVLFGPADPNGWPADSAKTDEREIRLGYFGAVTAWQLDALALLVDGLSAAQARLDIYSGINTLPPELNRHGVSLKGHISAHAVTKTMRSYDAVVLPISFRPELRHMSEFNIATKMSECLASGTITLVIGPTYAAMTRFLEPTGAACFITEHSLSDWPMLANNLKKLEFRQSVLKRAFQLVSTEMTTSIMRNRLALAYLALDTSVLPTMRLP